MRTYFSFLMVLLLLLANFSYGRQGRPVQQRIHAAKMTYITDRMQLTEEQSSKFVPTYNEYEKELLGIRKTFFKKYNISQDDDVPTRLQLEDDLDYQQQVIELKRKYNDRFLKIISPKQLTDMYAGEREFRQVLIRRLQQRRGNNRNK